MPARRTTLLQFLATLLVLVVGTPLLFWLCFGDFAIGYGLAIAGGLALFSAGIFFADVMPTDVETPNLPRRWYDVFGPVWALSIFLGPFFGWIASTFLAPDNWALIAWIITFLCVLLPTLSVLSLVRWVRGKYAYVALNILLIGTGFPVIIGAGAAYDALFGPVWQDVGLVDVRDLGDAKPDGASIALIERSGAVRLPDGHVVVEAGSLHVPYAGRARLLLLRGLSRIIAVEPAPAASRPEPEDRRESNKGRKS